MSNICITGSEGFLGKNFYFALKNSNIDTKKIYLVNRKTKKNELKKIINKADYIFHFAGENRSKNSKNFTINNLKITQFIVDNINFEKKICFFYSSTSKINEKSDYGTSKKSTENYLIKNKLKFKKLRIVRFNNIFGKWSRPYHNSVVATWCYNFNNSILCRKDSNVKLKLHYIEDVMNLVLNFFNEKKQFKISEFKKSYKITLNDLYRKIKYFSEYNTSVELPRLQSKFDEILYSTYCSYIPKKNRLISTKSNKDIRGDFSEILKYTKNSGQISIVKCNVNQKRGGHYHNEKLERFFCLTGKLKIITFDLNNKKRDQFILNSSKLQFFKTIPGELHTVINIGNCDSIFITWANEIFDTSYPDTYSLKK